MNAVAGRSGGERLRGNFDTTEYDGGPKKPDGLPQAISDEWDYIVPLLPAEALRRIDVLLLRQLCGYSAAWKISEQEWILKPTDKDIRCAMTQYTEKMRQLSGQFGLSPADRKRLQLALPKEEKDDLEEFTD